MELRHLRCFLAVAEELHFARAAERLHIEQSPLSRAIKELEEDLGVMLFARTTRSTRLTRAGKLLQEHVPRVFTALRQARDSVTAVANGFHDQLRVALSDGVTPLHLPVLLALCREEEPEVEIRFFEVPLLQLIKGLHDDLYDIGFALSDEAGDGIVATPVWSDPLRVAVPARHPLLAHKRIPLEEVLRYPLVLCDPDACEGQARQIERVLRRVDVEPLIAERGGLRRPDDGPGVGRFRLGVGRRRAATSIFRRNPRHEEDHAVSAGSGLGCLQPVRSATEGRQFGGKHPNGGRTGGQPRTAQGAAAAMQDRPSQAGRHVVQPGRCGHPQAVLWRRRNPRHTAERAAKF